MYITSYRNSVTSLRYKTAPPAAENFRPRAAFGIKVYLFGVIKRDKRGYKSIIAVFLFLRFAGFARLKVASRYSALFCKACKFRERVFAKGVVLFSRTAAHAEPADDFSVFNYRNAPADYHQLFVVLKSVKSRVRFNERG